MRDTIERVFLLESKYLPEKKRLCIVSSWLTEEAKPKQLAHAVMKLLTETDDAIDEVTVTELQPLGDPMVFKIAEDFPLDIIFAKAEQ